MDAGLTQAALAMELGVSRKTINTVENGVFVPSVLLALGLGGLGEIDPRGLVEIHREVVFRQPNQAFGEAIDRVVLARQR